MKEPLPHEIPERNPAYEKFVHELAESVSLNVFTPHGRALKAVTGKLAVDNPTPPSLCVHCGELCEWATGKPGEKPIPGAVSICSHCSGIMLFDDQLHLRKPTPEEAAEIASDPRVQKLLAELERQRPKAKVARDALREAIYDPTRDRKAPKPEPKA